MWGWTYIVDVNGEVVAKLHHLIEKVSDVVLKRREL